MGSEWPTCSLKEASVQLIDCDHKTPKAQETGFPYIGIPQMKEGNIDFDANPRLISQSDLVTWTKKAKPQTNDVILSRRCNSGETAHVSSRTEFALGQNLVILRSVGERVFPPYLRWVVRSPQWWAEVGKYLNPGAIFESLKCADIPKFKVPFPPIPEQKAIAHILGSLDDKIELNRRMNATLEGMAQALFKSWFVDFDPVIDNAIKAGNPIPDELAARAEVRRQALADGTANREAAKPFPAAFQETDSMGWIPEGWETQALYDIANFVNGAAYKGADFSGSPEALPVIKIAEIKAGIAAQTKFTQVNKGDKYRVEDGDILLSWSGNPDTSIDTFIWTDGPGYLNQHIFNVRLHDELERYFVYYQLKHLRSTFAEIARDKQTTGLGHFTAGDMKRLMVFKLKSPLLDHFNTAVSSIYLRSYANRLAIKTLTKLRDTLLPKLISGELRIPETEQRTEEATHA